MIVTDILNRVSRRVFDHRTYRRRAVDRWLRANRPLLQGRVLDVGSKQESTKGLFGLEPAAGDRWYALDIVPDSSPSLIARGERLPFREGAFDAVVCSEVIEHVEDPAAVLAEIHRVLRPGGRLLLSSPFLYPIHGDPYDYQRLTETKLREYLETFSELDIRIAGYFATVVGDVLKRATHGTSRRHVYKYLLYPLLPCVHLWVLCERTSFFRKLCGWEGAVSGYLIVARK